MPNAACITAHAKMTQADAYNWTSSGGGLVYGQFSVHVGDVSSVPAPGNHRYVFVSSSLSDVGNACAAGTTHVLMQVSDHEALRSHVSAVTTENVAQVIAGMCLVWAVAWLTKRAIRVLIPNA